MRSRGHPRRACPVGVAAHLRRRRRDDARNAAEAALPELAREIAAVQVLGVVQIDVLIENDDVGVRQRRLERPQAAVFEPQRDIDERELLLLPAIMVTLMAAIMVTIMAIMVTTIMAMTVVGGG